MTTSHKYQAYSDCHFMSCTKTFLLGVLLCSASLVSASDENGDQKSGSSSSVSLSQEVLNPTALLWQMQLEEHAVFDTKHASGFGQNFRLRAIIPIEEGLLIKVPQLFRIIGYVNTVPDGDTGTGLGSTTLEQFFILGKKDWGEWGLGWDLMIPTADNDRLGSKQWQAGPSATITFTDLGNWQLYFVWENFFAISDTHEYGHTAYAVVQPNLFYTWSNGIYVGTEPEWKFDYKSGDVAIPLNFRVGYIYQKGKYKYNANNEPEWMTYRSNY
jgi:hypothetical protein